MLPPNIFQERINSRTLSSSDSLNNNQKTLNLSSLFVLRIKEKQQENMEKDDVEIFHKKVSQEKFNSKTLPNYSFLDKNLIIKNVIPHLVLEINEKNQSNEEKDEDQGKIIKSLDEERPTLNCIICLSDKPLDNFNPILKHDFCNNCIQIYIKECINSSKILNIICPCSDKCGVSDD